MAAGVAKLDQEPSSVICLALSVDICNEQSVEALKTLPEAVACLIRFLRVGPEYYAIIFVGCLRLNIPCDGPKIIGPNVHWEFDLDAGQEVGMAKPRVFVSSTFYDLRQVREDLDRFISGIGYEAVLFEEGDVAYGKDGPPEGYVHREIELCDMLICVIGGRYGTESQEQPGSSITQLELRTALENQVQVFIFIEQSVYSEYSTYLLNKENADIKYRFVDNPLAYEFIESVHNLPRNNPITPFQTASDIVEFLRNQWAGLFQRFLQDQKRIQEIRALEEMKSVAGTLEQLVRFLTEERKNGDDAIQQVLLANHPVFHRFQELTDTSYRVFFSDEDELNRWLKARNWKQAPKMDYDEESYREWIDNDSTQYIRLTEAIFDKEGSLQVYTEDKWEDSWLQLIAYPAQAERAPSRQAPRRRPPPA